MTRIGMKFSALVAALSMSVTLAVTAQGQVGGVFTLSIPAFEDGGTIPIEYTQAAPGAAPGEGASPELIWSNPPAGTRSFVLHMSDLDVARSRTTETQLHWLVWNIPADATGLPRGMQRGATLPDGSHQTSATGHVYRGPGAPASRPPHHYFFELYALDTEIDIEPTDDAFADRARVLEAMQGHVLGKSVYMGRFRRPE